MSLGPRALAALATLAAIAVVAGCAGSRTARDAAGSATVGSSPSEGGGAIRGSVGSITPGTPGAPATSAAAETEGRRGFPPGEYSPIGALQPVHFDFDRSDVRPEDHVVLDRNAGWMLENRRYRILIEGHADARGTDEYNLTLGDRRAKSTMNYLVSKGVPADRLGTISYGEERPVCTESTDGCWAKNRRASFLVRGD